MTKQQVDAWLKQDLSQLPIVAVMIDAFAVGEHAVVVALGIDESGRKHPLGLWLGATENAAVCGALLDNLIERGLDGHQSYLFVIDGSKAVQRCQEHKRRNVLRQLPKRLHSMASKSMRDAYKSKTKSTARARLLQLVGHLEDTHPDAAASLREGLDETLTLKDLNLSATLERTLSTTNPIENLNGGIRRVVRRVKRWRDGQMVRRWVAAGILEARRGFRRLRGHKSMPALVAALRRDAEHSTRIDGQETAA